jgi:hypothetical protein
VAYRQAASHCLTGSGIRRRANQLAHTCIAETRRRAGHEVPKGSAVASSGAALFAKADLTDL